MVIAIVAILIALLLPALAKARQSTLRVLCANNLHQLCVGYASYSLESNDWLPANDVGAGSSLAIRETFDMSFFYWPLAQRLQSDHGVIQKIWDCPAARDIDGSTVHGLAGWGAWTAPFWNSGAYQVAVGYTVWAGRISGFMGTTNNGDPGAGFPPEEMPLKASDRKMVKNTMTPMPWFNCNRFYRPYFNSWGYLSDNDFNDPQVFHWRMGMSSAQPDGAVVWKRWTGLETNMNADPMMVKFTGVCMTFGYWQTRYAY